MIEQADDRNANELPGALVQRALKVRDQPGLGEVEFDLPVKLGHDLGPDVVGGEGQAGRCFGFLLRFASGSFASVPPPLGVPVLGVDT